MTELLPPSRPERVRSVVVLFVLLAIFAGVAAVVDALGDEPTNVTEIVGSADGDDDVPAEPSGPLEGNFVVSGSSTVFPIVLKQAEEFSDANPGLAIAVEGPGSGDGARKFCAGEVPIANASRLYKDEEIAICEDAGIEFIELRRAIDRVWGYDYVGDTKTLDVHIKRLRAKIEPNPKRPEVIVTIRSLGYKLVA